MNKPPIIVTGGAPVIGFVSFTPYDQPLLEPRKKPSTSRRPKK